MKKITFTPTGEFTIALRERVREYFVQKNISETGNWTLYTKAILLMLSLIFCYIGVTFANVNDGIRILLWVVLGLTFAGIGFNVMHDSAHGSFSKNKKLNNIVSHILNVIGAEIKFWKVKHNVLHHTFTNISPDDNDINIYPILRITNEQKRLWFHRFQHLYCWLIYFTYLLFWIFVLDFQKYITKKIGAKKMEFNAWDHVRFWLTKVTYVVTFIVLPGIFVGWNITIIGYLICMAVTGFVIANIFQVAHVVEGAEFVQAETMPDNVEWTKHEVETTVNFGKSWILTQLVGGLNNQIEHHLFHKVSHVHYPAIRSIVKQTCLEFHVQYKENRNFFTAISSHFRYMRSLAIK